MNKFAVKTKEWEYWRNNSLSQRVKNYLKRNLYEKTKFNTKNIFKSAIGVLWGYLFLFFCAIIPSIVALPYIWQNQIDSAEKLYNAALNSGLIQVTRQALPLSLTTANQQAWRVT